MTVTVVSKARIVAAVVAFLAVHAPSAALACSVCFTGVKNTLPAFQITTALLTFTPLIVIGTFVYVLYRRIQAAEAA